jgi:hypothetical protein
VIAFNIPLSCNDKLKSHSALGRMNETVVVSKTDAKQQGIAVNNKNKLNFPYCVADTAVSKSALSEKEEKTMIKKN